MNNSRLLGAYVHVLSITLMLFAGGARAVTLQADQQGGTISSGGYNSPVVQTFMPGQNNMAGLDVLIIGSAVFVEDITVNLYSSLDLITPIATGTILDHPRNTLAEFRWDAVAVTPDTSYRLEFLTGSLLVAAHISNTTDPYNRGNIIQGGGNLNFLYEDALFTTYYDADFSPVPLPHAVWLFGSGLIGLIGVARRKKL
ncbi:MAG: hypothetical protein WBN96_02410 [Gammaproteobacteria bacterium]